VDFVAFPINHQHFQATLERVLHVQTVVTASTKPGRLIVMASLKGGVGRSTLAANLAVALRQRQRGEVILAEAHYGLSHLSLLLNLHPRHTLANLATEANLDLDLLQGFLQPHSSGVRLLATPSELAPIVEIERETWQRILALLTQMAAYVIVDTAATTDAILSEVLLRADDVLLITGPEIASLYSTRALLGLMRAEKEIHARLHLVLNQAGVSGGLSAATIEKHLGEKLQASILTDPPVATYALNRGVPFVISHARAPISRSLQRLVDQLLVDTPDTDSAAQRLPMLLNFLGQRKQGASNAR
ncbi:MAG: AAA family ATPase, partial [Chloroflexi bacterium]|nr:AAA family ATPase [Chloroflexota bacterium]